jgi:hypothetical protein
MLSPICYFNMRCSTFFAYFCNNLGIMLQAYFLIFGKGMLIYDPFSTHIQLYYHALQMQNYCIL